jgi:hypothetical protein
MPSGTTTRAASRAPPPLPIAAGLLPRGSSQLVRSSITHNVFFTFFFYG